MTDASLPVPMMIHAPLLLLLTAAAPQSSPELLSAAAVPESGLPGRPIDMSSDGRYVLVESTREDVIAGQTSEPGSAGLFLIDRVAGTGQLVNHAGDQVTVPPDEFFLSASAMDESGEIVVFLATTDFVPGFSASGIVQAYVFSRSTGQVVPLTRSANNPSLGIDASVRDVEISGSGEVVVLRTAATDVIPGFTPGDSDGDLYLLDRTTATRELITANASLPQTGSSRLGLGSARNLIKSIDWSGRFIGFDSTATDLIAGYPTSPLPVEDAFVFDRTSGAISLVTRGLAAPGRPLGGKLQHLSRDGAKIFFSTNARGIFQSGATGTYTGFNQLGCLERSTGFVSLITKKASPGFDGTAGNSEFLDASADGRQVLFRSSGDDLMAGLVDNNSSFDVFLHDTVLGRTTHLLSHAPGLPLTTPAEGGAWNTTGLLSANGQMAAFVYTEAALEAGTRIFDRVTVDSYVYDLQGSGARLLSRSAGAQPTGASDDDALVAMSGDGSLVLRSARGQNLASGPGAADSVPLVSSTSTLQASPVLAPQGPALSSGNGPSAMFARIADQFKVQRSASPVSDDGSIVVFRSTAGTLVDGFVGNSDESNLFLSDARTGDVRLVNHAGDRLSTNPTAAREGVVTGDGSTVFFLDKSGPGYVSPTAFLHFQVFAHDVATGAVTLVSSSRSDPLQFGDSESSLAAVSRDGRFVVLVTRATDLVPGATDSLTNQDLVLIDRVTDQRTLISRRAGANQAADGRSTLAWITADASRVYFLSTALDLVPGVTSGSGSVWNNLYSYDVATGAVELINHAVSAPLVTSDRLVLDVAVSDDGSAIFTSEASDLIAGFSTPPGAGAFVSNIYYQAPGGGAVELAVSDASDPTQGLNEDATIVTMSGDGTSFIFLTAATNVIPGFVDSNGPGVADLYHKDLITGTTRLVSHPAGLPSVGISGLVPFVTISRRCLSSNGRRVLWNTRAQGVVTGHTPSATGDWYLTNIATGVTTVAAGSLPGSAVFGEFRAAVLTPDGRSVMVDVFNEVWDPEDRNEGFDVYRVSLEADCLGQTLCAGGLNSVGRRAELCLEGSDRAAANDMTLSVAGLPPSVFGLFAASSDTGVIPNLGGGNGDLCIAGTTLGRYGASIVMADLLGELDLDIDLASIPNGPGTTAATSGSSFAWQLWYRDTVGGMSTSNLSSASAIVFR